MPSISAKLKPSFVARSGKSNSTVIAARPRTGGAELSFEVPLHRLPLVLREPRRLAQPHMASARALGEASGGGAESLMVPILEQRFDQREQAVECPAVGGEHRAAGCAHRAPPLRRPE